MYIIQSYETIILPDSPHENATWSTINVFPRVTSIIVHIVESDNNLIKFITDSLSTPVKITNVNYYN